LKTENDNKTNNNLNETERLLEVPVYNSGSFELVNFSDRVRHSPPAVGEAVPGLFCVLPEFD